MDDEASIRDLRNHGGDIVDRAQQGERVVITRSGRPVAALVPLPKAAIGAAALIERRRSLPIVDPDRMRSDIDDVMDPSL